MATAEALPNEGAAEAVFPNRHVALVGTGLLTVGVALAATNLRPAVTSLSSMLGDVRGSLGASSTWASVITAVPTLCFGLAAFAAPWLGRRLGMARAVALSLTVLTVGLLLRVIDGPAVLLGGTFIACAGIAVCNVLIPVVVKDSFPKKLGLVTGIYTAALSAGGAFGAALTPPLESWVGGWRPALGAWALLSIGALVVWLAGARHGAATRVAGGTPTRNARRSLARSPLAWVITAFFGLQSLLAYAVMGWLPQVLQDAGVDKTTSGVLLAVTMVLGVPISLLVPPIAARWSSQTPMVLMLGTTAFAGVAGLAFAPAAAPGLWVVLVGIGMGMFPLALTMISLRTKSSADTARLSAMAQSIGYLVSASGPFLFGVLHGLTGGWTVSLVGLLVVVTLIIGLGSIAGRPRTI
ncbi:CynX/NimT family MFS transporter [Solihabitans fulvus]|uniref:CynX/NimT family MFS transporter n=1 Tax=Solihabitans fulvus TaxID=1892852 RepID=UPI001CB76069|nr:MFS transporter [Solihabitans fulvus]